MKKTSEVTHTPGPWEVLRSNHNLYIGHKSPSKFATTGFHWAFVIRPFPEQRSGAKRGCSPNWYGWSPRIEANASLIAAAPELLEALRELTEDFETWLLEHDVKLETQSRLKLAKDAIAKASGATATLAPLKEQL